MTAAEIMYATAMTPIRRSRRPNRTMNPVTLSYAQALLKDAEIESFLFDMNSSVLDGSTITVRRRLMIIDEDEEEARAILEAAGLGKELM